MVGPLCFITSWAVLGVTADRYDPVRDTISRLAAVGAPSRGAMTAALVVFGLGLVLYGAALRSCLPGRAWMPALATGAATLAVALFPLGDGRDGLHDGWAALAYLTLAAIPLVATQALAAQGREGWARWSTVTGAVSGLCLLASTLLAPAGLLQRLGLTIVDVWVVISALSLLSGSLAPATAPGDITRGDAERFK